MSLTCGQISSSCHRIISPPIESNRIESIEPSATSSVTCRHGDKIGGLSIPRLKWLPLCPWDKRGRLHLVHSRKFCLWSSHSDLGLTEILLNLSSLISFVAQFTHWAIKSWNVPKTKTKTKTKTKQSLLAYLSRQNCRSFSFMLNNLSRLILIFGLHLLLLLQMMMKMKTQASKMPAPA